MTKTSETIRAKIWMDYFFSSFGDHIPNSNGEIHFDPCDKKDIYTEYIDDHKHMYGKEFLLIIFNLPL